MKKSIILFLLRLFIYLSVLLLIYFHPAIPVSYDRIGIFQWFIIVPLLSIIAFIPVDFFSGFNPGFKLNLLNKIICSLIFLLPLSLIAAGLSVAVFLPLITGIISFFLTYLLFFYPRFGKLSILEPFFLAWIIIRLLSFSRSGEDIAMSAAAFVQFIFVWAAVVFLLHSVVVYLCLYPKSAAGIGKEGLLFATTSFAALLLIAFILPADFVSNMKIDNLLPERIPKQIKSSTENGMPQESNGRRSGRRTVPEGKNEKRGSLRGISEYNWQNKTGRSRSQNGQSEDNKQYMVMVVASDREPIYMGNTYNGQLDPVEGFLVSPEENINKLINQHLFVTWNSNEREKDYGRQRQEVFSLSTIPQKHLPWRPIAVDPVIISEDTGPLRYIHQVVSNTHFDDPLKLVNRPGRSLSDTEKAALLSYLNIFLDDNDYKIFSDYVKNVLDNWGKNRNEIIQDDDFLKSIFNLNRSEDNYKVVNQNIEILLAILTSFSEYQYNLTYDDDCSISVIKEFLFDKREGDCVEFSNSLALLGRIAGIPSRVVTGYLAAESLQTPAHLSGLANLREKIPILRNFPFNNLFMVTNLHNHSWTQFYIPDYGWLDFEATAFAIPPVGSGDFSTWDVVIPIINEKKVFSQIRKFPWRETMYVIGIFAGFSLIAAYILRYARELILLKKSGRGGRKSARSLYLLLLAKLAADGKPVKPASKTALEYAEIFPSKLTNMDNMADAASFSTHLASFAKHYTELRYRTFPGKTEEDMCFSFLKNDYNNIIKAGRRVGFISAVKRIVSLRGLAYL